MSYIYRIVKPYRLVRDSSPIVDHVPMVLVVTGAVVYWMAVRQGRNVLP